MIKFEQMLQYGEPIFFTDDETGEWHWAGTAVAYVLGGSSTKTGTAMVLESWEGEGLVKWNTGKCLTSIRGMKTWLKEHNDDAWKKF